MSRVPYSPQAPFNRSVAVRKVTPTTKGAREYLQASNNIAALLPAVERMMALQRDCTTALPTLFDGCTVMQFSAGHLTLSVPNAALAAKLKQRLPGLQESLGSRGWQVNAIRLRVQVNGQRAATAPAKQLAMPNAALQAFSALEHLLPSSPQSAMLKEAVQAMLKRHGSGKR